MHNHKLKPYSNVKPKENLKVLSFSKCPQSNGPMLELVLTKMIKQIYTHTLYHECYFPACGSYKTSALIVCHGT